MTGPGRRADALLVNRAVASVLAAGSILATAVIAVGLAGWLLAGAPRGEGEELRRWLDGMARLEPGSIIFAGLLLVTLTPLAQLLTGFGAFARLGEWRYAVASLAVAGVLVASLVAALVLGLQAGA